jgi:hypothetical protein
MHIPRILDDTCRFICIHSQKIAEMHEAESVTCEHVLLCVFFIAPEVKPKLAITTEQWLSVIRETLSSLHSSANRTQATVPDRKLKRAIAYAAEEAERARPSNIGPEDPEYLSYRAGPEFLVMGVLRETSSAAAQILLRQGITQLSMSDKANTLPQ